MTRSDHFERIAIADETGVYADGTFALSHEFGAARQPVTFSLCNVGNHRVAVFFLERPMAAELRAEIGAAKPDCLDAIMFAEVPSRSEPVIEATLHVPDLARYTRYAFAAAVVARSHGAFAVEPTSCVVRFPEVTVAVTIDFDWDTESFFGDASARS